MAHIQAISVGHALNIDMADFGAVHSVFSHAVNLTVRGDMWTLLSEAKTDLPFGIRLALPNLQALGLCRGDVVNVRSRFVGIGSRLVVDCRAAPRWLPACAARPVPGLERRLAVVAAAAGNKSWHESAAMAKAVRYAVAGASGLGDVLARVVGRGPGATPSGDDVLVGVLSVLTSPHSSVAGARAAKSLGRALLSLLPTTTQVSSYLIRQAMNGHFGRAMHELVNALIGESTPRQFSEKVNRVIETGATSGADMCEGLLAFAPYYFATRNERVSA